MKENRYDDEVFFKKYGEMTRSKKGLQGAGEWHALRKILSDFSGKKVLDLEGMKDEMRRPMMLLVAAVKAENSKGKQDAKNEKTNDFGRDSVPLLVLKTSVPFMLAQLVNVLYSIVDRIYVGNIPVIGADSLRGSESVPRS